MSFLAFWLFLFILGLSLALPLGPVNLEILKQALFEKNHKLGFFSAFFTGLGAMSGDFTIAFSVLTLGSALLTGIINNYAVKTLLFGFNVGLLGYLGISTFRKKFDNSESIEDSLRIFEHNPETIEQKKAVYNSNGSIVASIRKRIITGFAIVISSPWTYLWWASFGSYIIFGDFNSFELSSRILIIICFLSGVFTWVVSFSSLLTLGKKFANDKFLNIITKLSSIVLLLYAGNFLLQTLTYLQLWLL